MLREIEPKSRYEDLINLIKIMVGHLDPQCRPEFKERTECEAEAIIALLEDL